MYIYIYVIYIYMLYIYLYIYMFDFTNTRGHGPRIPKFWASNVVSVSPAASRRLPLIVTHEFGSGIGAGHCHLLKGLDPAWPWCGQTFCARFRMNAGRWCNPWISHGKFTVPCRMARTAALCMDSLLCFLIMVVVTSHQRNSILSLQLIMPSPSTCQRTNPKVSQSHGW